jgi:hypothetical protein
MRRAMNRIASLLLCLFVLPSCVDGLSAIKTEKKELRSFDSSKYHSIAVITPADISDYKPSSPEADMEMKNAVGEELTKKGWNVLPGGKADLVMMIKQKVAGGDVASYSVSDYGVSPNRVWLHIVNGSLIPMRDAKSFSSFPWRGQATMGAHHPNISGTRIALARRMIIEQFPACTR